MRVLVAHNRYKFAGGEDSVVHAETAMLRSRGHDVSILEADNHAIEGTHAKLIAAASLFGSRDSYALMLERIAVFQPDVVHLHNWFPLLSPSVIKATVDAGIPIVHTLHNFRMVCAGANLYRDGAICHDCMGRVLPLGPMLHGCYQNSRIGSAAVSAAFAYHRAAGTWDAVTTFITLTEFHHGLLLQSGLDPNRVIIKPNFAPDHGGLGRGEGGYALFAGRLTAEKGIRTVLNAWEQYSPGIPLRILGDGPLADEVQHRAARIPGVEYLGQRPPEEVSAAMADAMCLVFPSSCYESFALTIIESFARGTPVIAARLDSILGLVHDADTGYTFTPDDAEALAASVRRLHAEPETRRAMRRRCRAFYENGYTESINYGLLTQVYEDAIQKARRPIESADILGIRVDAVNMSQTLGAIRQALAHRRKGYICLTGAHGVIAARRDPLLKRVLQQAALVLPDGMPTVWLGRLQGFRHMDRVFGPELMLEIFASSAMSSVRHFFCGGDTGVADALASAMHERYPTANICGTFTPPFRPMSNVEEQVFESLIAEAQPDIIWVGLSTPKQELFMARTLSRLDTTLMIGVGAAFLFHTGAITDSPRWVKRSGLQWLHRLLQEPRRLARRYLTIVPAFLWLALLRIFTRRAPVKGRPSC